MIKPDPVALRRDVRAPTAPLPAEARTALAAVVADMRDVPRAIIGDPAEVVHFLGRQARRLAGIRDMRVPTPLPSVPKAPSAALMAPGGLAVRAEAEAAFSKPTRRVPPVHLPRSRAIVDGRGRRVPIILRRARAAGQIEMPL